jgi:hypothetical protein
MKVDRAEHSAPRHRRLGDEVRAHLKPKTMCLRLIVGNKGAIESTEPSGDCRVVVGWSVQL